MQKINTAKISDSNYYKLEEVLDTTLREQNIDIYVQELFEDDVAYYKPIYGDFNSQIEEGHGFHEVGDYEIKGYDLLISKADLELMK